MEKYNLFDYEVDLNREATAKWYASSDGWACECGHCRNFLRLAKERALPAPVMEALDKLEIDPEKATYVCELYTDDRGMLYQFSYRIAGKILSAANLERNEDWGSGRCCHEPYPYGAPGFPEPHFDLEFFARLPWVLEDVGKDGSDMVAANGMDRI